MAIRYCALCERPVEARRRVGFGTYVAAFLSMGISLLAVPFYRPRCPICGSTALLKLDSGDPRLAATANPAARVKNLQERLALSEDELDAMSTDLERAQAERDFYRELRGDPEEHT